MNHILAGALFVLIGCGGSKPTATTAPATTAATTAPQAAAPSAVLTIVELAFYDGDDLGMKLAADGTVTAKATRNEAGKPESVTWRPVVKLASDGTVTAHDQLIGQLKPDGTFEKAGGGAAPFHLEGTALVAGDRRITIDDKGTLVGVMQRERPARVEGAKDDGSRRTALLLLGVLYGMGGATTTTHSAVGPDGKPPSGN